MFIFLGAFPRKWFFSIYIEQRRAATAGMERFLWEKCLNVCVLRWQERYIVISLKITEPNDSTMRWQQATRYGVYLEWQNHGEMYISPREKGLIIPNVDEIRTISNKEHRELGRKGENEIEIEKEACESARESFNIFDFMSWFWNIMWTLCKIANACYCVKIPHLSAFKYNRMFNLSKRLQSLLLSSIQYDWRNDNDGSGGDGDGERNGSYKHT